VAPPQGRAASAPQSRSQRLSDAHQTLGFGSFAHSGLGCLIVVLNSDLMAAAVRPSHRLACNFCSHIPCPDRIDGGRIEA
jgi:hypothetical protein